MVNRKVSADERRRMIAEAAYFRAERRGFSDGRSLEDWIEAEAEVDARLTSADGPAVLAELEERLATAGKKLQALRKKVAGIEADARAEWQPDLERLGGLRDSLEARLKEIRAEGQQATHKLKEQAEQIWREITEIIERRSVRRKSRPRS